MGAARVKLQPEQSGEGPADVAAQKPLEPGRTRESVYYCAARILYGANGAAMPFCPVGPHGQLGLSRTNPAGPSTHACICEVQTLVNFSGRIAAASRSRLAAVRAGRAVRPMVPCADRPSARRARPPVQRALNSFPAGRAAGTSTPRTVRRALSSRSTSAARPASAACTRWAATWSRSTLARAKRCARPLPPDSLRAAPPAPPQPAFKPPAALVLFPAPVPAPPPATTTSPAP
jgi:hypothetical protein